NPQTNQIIATVPAKFVEMTYSTNVTPNVTSRGYFILTATNATPPNLGTTKGYSVFYEGSSTTLPLAVGQIFDSFEFIAAPTPSPAAPQTTTPTPAPIPADYIEVRSALFGAVINHPPDWEVRPPYNSPHGYSLLHIFAPEGEQGVFTADRPNFNVEVAEERGAMADYEARAWLEQRAFELMAIHEQFEIIESVPTTVAGQPAWMIKYTFTSLISDSEVTHMQILGGVAGRTYLLTYSSPVEHFDEYLPAVQHMLNSFRVE
ncbi:MAG TPA: hypothetical protein VFZ67_03760, partial [Nitrososphaera sp.]